MTKVVLNKATLEVYPNAGAFGRDFTGLTSSVQGFCEDPCDLVIRNHCLLSRNFETQAYTLRVCQLAGPTRQTQVTNAHGATPDGLRRGRLLPEYLLSRSVFHRIL